VGDETVHQPHNRLEYEGDNMVLKYVLGINSRRGGVIGEPCFVLLCDFKQHREPAGRRVQQLAYSALLQCMVTIAIIISHSTLIDFT
jgi:hypothetical protein